MESVCHSPSSGSTTSSIDLALKNLIAHMPNGIAQNTSSTMCSIRQFINIKIIKINVYSCYNRKIAYRNILVYKKINVKQHFLFYVQISMYYFHTVISLRKYTTLDDDYNIKYEGIANLQISM
jgi:hypothetical protein